jgi:hypothetical protein
MSEDTKPEAIKWDGLLVFDIYKKGIEGGLTTDIMEMTIEAFRSYNDGYRRTPIIISGEVLHRLNCECILQFTKTHGEIQYYVNENGVKRLVNLKSSEILGDYKAAEQLIKDFSLCETINYLQNKGVFKGNIIMDMHALRYIRNSAVHSLIQPRLTPHNKPSSLSREKILEIILSEIDDGQLPLEDRQYKFTIEIRKNKWVEYIVDQERLGIEVEKVEPKRWMSTVSLAVLFSIMREINKIMPIK